MNRLNIAARAGAWSAANRKKAIFGWLAFVMVAAVIGAGMLGTKTDSHDGNGQSLTVDTFLRAHFPDSSTEMIMVQARSGGLSSSPAYRAAVRDVVARVSRVPHVFNVRTPGSGPGHNALSADGRSARVSLELGKHGDVDRLLAATASVQRAFPSMRIEEFGDASSQQAQSKTLGRDFSRAETLSVPVTLLILVLAFGSLVAAGVPMLLGLTAVGASLGLIAVVSHAMSMDPAIDSVVLLVGLAVGIDYSLFYLRREREERAAGASEEAALRAAAATSGRAILISGLTVMTAMAGMFFAGSKTFTSFAVGTIIVVAVAIVGSLTVLPAVISALGPRIERGRIPLLRRLRRSTASESRAWSLLLRGVVSRPGLAAGLSGLALVALTVPVLSMHTALPGASALPRNLPIMRTYEQIEAAFPGGQEPGVVGVLAPDVRTAGVQAGVARLVTRARATPGLLGPVSTRISADGRAETVSIPLAGSGTNGVSDQALARLRSLVPRTIGTVHGVEAGVSGETAGTVDFDNVMNSRLPIVFAFVLAMAFLLLLFTFRSIVIPFQAILLNLLSVGAAYGLLVLVFQHGIGHQLLGFSGTSEITAWLPLFLFVILFGLSMDYHVFILSRVREAYDRGMSARDATLHGVRTTAGVVTSAALVMVGVFAIFGTLSVIDFKQMGVGLAAAILIDATVIRGVLLPATLALLGDRAWYLPAWLEWLPGAGRNGAERRPARPAQELAVSAAQVPEAIHG